MNKELKIKLLTMVRVQGHAHSILGFVLDNRFEHIAVFDSTLNAPFDFISFKCGLDASKFSDAVTTWLKQNVLEWSQV